MAIRTTGGHGTTSILGGHGGNYVKASPPPFSHNSGMAGYAGPKTRAGGGLPGGSRGGKKSSVPSNGGTSKIIRK